MIPFLGLKLSYQFKKYNQRQSFFSKENEFDYNSTTFSEKQKCDKMASC